MTYENKKGGLLRQFFKYCIYNNSLITLTITISLIAIFFENCVRVMKQLFSLFMYHCYNSYCKHYCRCRFNRCFYVAVNANLM